MINNIFHSTARCVSFFDVATFKLTSYRFHPLSRKMKSESNLIKLISFKAVAEKNRWGNDNIIILQFKGKIKQILILRVLHKRKFWNHAPYKLNRLKLEHRDSLQKVLLFGLSPWCLKLLERMFFSKKILLIIQNASWETETIAAIQRLTFYFF